MVASLSNARQRILPIGRIAAEAAARPSYGKKPDRLLVPLNYPPMPEALSGLIERVTYHNPENGFAVLKVKVKGRQDLVTVVGSATSVSAGEHLEATGRWVVDREHGQQFKADEVKTTHPASAEGIERYLASGAIRSIGPKTAAKIVGIYKERTLEILDQYPSMLAHIKGIGPERLKRIRQSWQEQKEVRKIMLFLAEHGISSGRAVRIYRTYGQESIAKIKANPYRLADDIRGIGFKSADELAARLGIDRNSPFRARAAVQYTLQELAGKGHCGYPEHDAVEQTTRLVEIDERIVRDAVEAAVRDATVIREKIECESWLYLVGLHRAEVGLAQQSHHHHVEGIGGGLEGCPCAGDCDASCRDEAFCKAHGLPWTPLHTHDHEHDQAHAHHHHHHDEPHALLANPGKPHAHDHGHHDHDHDHHHHPYPHAAHPHGPVTLPRIQGRLARERGRF